MLRVFLLLLAYAFYVPAWGEESGPPSSMDMDIVPPHKGFILVGDLMPDCKSVQKDHAPAKIPKGFRVSPAQAIATTLHEGALVCSKQFYITLSADKSSYLIISLNTAIDTFPITSFLLDGKTGKLKKIVLKVKNRVLHYHAEQGSQPN